MKKTFSILTAIAMAIPAMAETTPAANFDGVPAISPKRVSGFVAAGFDTNYSGRGYVISHTVAEGDGAEFVAARLNYDFGKERGRWTGDTTLSYRSVHSGHALYGNPTYGSEQHKIGAMLQMRPDLAAAFGSGALSYNDLQGIAANVDDHIKYCNLENEFAVKTAIRYTTIDEKWSFGAGHSFVHGGLIGVMAKHFRGRCASNTNEAFLTARYSPFAWVDLNMTVDYSFQGIHGWWFEPSVTFKAPLIGSPEDVKLAARLTFSLTATADYFNGGDFACNNGTQAFWIKLDTPWFVTEDKDVVITPYVSFNWLGKGGLKANEHSKFATLTGYAGNVPFRNFGVVAGVSVMYTF